MKKIKDMKQRMSTGLCRRWASSACMWPAPMALVLTCAHARPAEQICCGLAAGLGRMPELACPQQQLAEPVRPVQWPGRFGQQLAEHVRPVQWPGRFGQRVGCLQGCKPSCSACLAARWKRIQVVWNRIWIVFFIVFYIKYGYEFT